MKTNIANIQEETHTYKTKNDIPEHPRLQLNELMNQRLASAIDLQMQMKQAHWNVKGPSFIGLHELFDKVDEAVEGYVDQIAERIVELGGIAEGTVRVAAFDPSSKNIRLRLPRALPTLTRSPLPFRPLVGKPASQSTRLRALMMPTQRTFSQRFHVGSINGCGLSKLMLRPRNNNLENIRKAEHRNKNMLSTAEKTDSESKPMCFLNLSTSQVSRCQTSEFW